MSILQVTPTEFIEHVWISSEERHPRLNTIEAVRFIAGLGLGERNFFENIRDKDGKVDPKQQELYMKSKWTVNEKYGELAGHTASRALQSVRHFILTSEVTAEEPVVAKRMYFPLLETPQDPNVANLHWDQELRFRRGVGKMLATVLHHSDVTFPDIYRGKALSERAQDFNIAIGVVAVNNQVMANEEQIIGSNYIFTKFANLADQA